MPFWIKAILPRSSVYIINYNFQMVYMGTISDKSQRLSYFLHLYIVRTGRDAAVESYGTMFVVLALL